MMLKMNVFLKDWLTPKIFFKTPLRSQNSVKSPGCSLAWELTTECPCVIKALLYYCEKSFCEPCIPCEQRFKHKLPSIGDNSSFVICHHLSTYSEKWMRIFFLLSNGTFYVNLIEKMTGVTTSIIMLFQLKAHIWNKLIGLDETRNTQPLHK